jgi:hypothetical protein
VQWFSYLILLDLLAVLLQKAHDLSSDVRSQFTAEDIQMRVHMSG